MVHRICSVCLPIFLQIILIQFVVTGAYAAIPRAKIPDSIKAFLPEGSFRGGGAGVGFSLLGVKRVYSIDGKSERIILEIGDKDGRIYSGKPGYFHAQLFRNPSELTLDLSQLLKSKVSAMQLKDLMKKSKLIKNVDMSSDLEDHSTNISMRFKSPVKMRVFTLSPKQKSPKLVIDITKL